MENIFVKNNKKRFKQIMIEVELANKLKSIVPGSYNTAIKKLLTTEKDNSSLRRLEALEEQINDIITKLERLVKINNLRV